MVVGQNKHLNLMTSCMLVVGKHKLSFFALFTYYIHISAFCDRIPQDGFLGGALIQTINSKGIASIRVSRDHRNIFNPVSTRSSAYMYAFMYLCMYRRALTEMLPTHTTFFPWAPAVLTAGKGK
jgi:hypothetical protein